MNVSLSPETIFHLGGLAITNSILTGWLVSIFLLLIGFLVRHSLKAIPGALQNGLEILYSWLFDLTNSIIGRSDVSAELFPYLITIFLFIVISNWSGLLPGFGSIGVYHIIAGKRELVPFFRAPTTDLNTVAVLALFSMGYVQYLGFKYAGLKGYTKRFINFESPIACFVGILELMGEFIRVISFTFRLFGNVFAGEVLISVMLYLTVTLLPYVAIIPLPFFLLELFVGIIQAFIFCFLTIIFASLAVESHDSSGHSHGGNELHLAHESAEADPLSPNPHLQPTNLNRSHL